MQPIAYLCFTLLSILIQFSLLDFITTNDEDDISLDNLKLAYKKNEEIFNKIKQTPHALYYQTEKIRLQEKSNLIFPFKYSNVTLTEPSFLSSTEIGTTVFDLLYDDNVSSIDDHFTSETPVSSTEFDNVTEITLFDKKTSTAKPAEVPKKSMKTNKCVCNLLHDVCDVGCCCDDDCTKKEKVVFENCNNRNIERCVHCDKYQTYMCKDEETSGLYQSLFCIDKINLPEKAMKNKNVVYSTDTGNFYMWPKKDKNIEMPTFSKQLYVAGQMIWTITNKKLNILEIPIMQCNNYCGGTKAIKFLRNEEIKCLVKLQDLHMLNVIKSSEDTNIISPTVTAINSTVLNCSSVECVKWTLLICDDSDCLPYNKSLHEPTCSESYCTNIAVKVDYLFYCNESVITKAVIKLHVTRVSMSQQVVNQEIKINFYMTNDSIDNVVQLSGNIGYIKGLPIIASYSINNHTKDFFNNTVPKKRDITVPINRNGVCLLTNITKNILLFGQNKRMKCRLFLKRSTKIFNGTDECLRIQHQINTFLGASKKFFISPFGNPHGIGDEKWLGMDVLNNDVIYGEYRAKSSKLLCFNIVKSISFVFAFADTGQTKQENQILNARIEGSAENVTFDVEDLSLVLSIDTYFVDVSVPPMADFPEAPHLNIRFPKDLINFPSNKSNYLQSYYFLICMNFMLCLIK